VNPSARPIADAAPAGNIGLLAAWGRYPILVAERLRALGYRIYCLAVCDHATPQLADLCDDLHWVGLAKLGGAIAYFERHGVVEATMAGKFHKVLLYQPWLWLRHLPDAIAVRTFYHHFVTTKKDRRDDTLLGAIVDRFAVAGITFRPATDFAPELLALPGQLTSRGPSVAQQKDIAFGWDLAKEMGRLDVGQSVAVKDRAVLAVEAIEGTDACIRRAGGLCRKGGFTLVKVAKPQQDMRFDVPTIGPGTVRALAESGGRVLCIEANKTIVLDGPEVMELADRHKLVVVAYEPSHATRDADAA
jgi:hypothetical protein